MQASWLQESLPYTSQATKQLLELITDILHQRMFCALRHVKCKRGGPTRPPDRCCPTTKEETKTS